jgi:hypothetical protein
MVNAARPICPRCGAPISSDERLGLCPQCLLSDTQGGQSEHPPIPTASAERAGGKPGPALASAAEAVPTFFRGDALQIQGTQEEATAAFREATRIKPDDALHAPGKLEESPAEFPSANRIKPGNATARNNTRRVRWPPSSAGSATNGEVRPCSGPKSRSDLERGLHEIKGGKCPICNGHGPIDVRLSHVAWSIAFVPFWSSVSLVCCHSCGIRLRLGAIVPSLVFGLWAIPFCWIIPPLIHSWELGWIMAPLGLLHRLNTINFVVQVARNLNGVFFAPARQRMDRTCDAYRNGQLA